MKRIIIIFLLSLSGFASIAQTELQIPYSIRVLNPKPLDAYYYNTSGTLYTSTSQVTSQVSSSVRYIGQTFNVMGVEYWFGAGITNGDLVVKGSGSTYTSNNGITLTDNNFALGDALVSPTSISGITATNNFVLTGTTSGITNSTTHSANFLQSDIRQSSTSYSQITNSFNGSTALIHLGNQLSSSQFNTLDVNNTSITAQANTSGIALNHTITSSNNSMTANNTFTGQTSLINQTSDEIDISQHNTGSTQVAVTTYLNQQVQHHAFNSSTNNDGITNLTPLSYSTTINDGTNSTTIQSNSTDVGITAGNVTLNVGSGAGNFLVTDNRTIKTGLQYAADYSLTFTPLSFVNKIYVDAAVSAGTPDATPTTKGKAKLYTTTGSNTDGAMDQNSTTTALGTKQATLISNTNIKTVNGSSLLGSGDLGTIDVSHGGTGNTSFTANAIITAGTSSTGALQQVSGTGTSGQYLTSNGSSNLPSWQTPQRTIGNIYNETFQNLGNYTNSGGATASASGGVLTISGGTGAYTKYLYRTSVYTSIDWQYRKVTFSNTTDGTTGEGIGIGWVGRQANGAKETVFATLNNNTTTNRGQVLIKGVDFGGTVTTIATSATNLSFSNTDVITAYVVYNNGQTDAFFTNTTTGNSVHVGYTNNVQNLTGMMTVGCPALYILSGNQSITSDIWGSDNFASAQLVRMGNSITNGMYSTSRRLGEAQLTSQYVKGPVWIDAAVENGTQDLINCFNDIVLTAPKYVTIYSGTNDAIQYALSAGTTTTAGTHLYYMQQLINLCTSNNIIPIIEYSAPVTSSYSGFATYNARINAYNAAYATSFPGVIVIDPTTTIVSGGNLVSTYASSDFLHLNQAGHKAMSDTFIAAFPYIMSGSIVAGNTTEVQYNDAGVMASSSKLLFLKSTGEVRIGTTNRADIFPDFAGSGNAPAGSIIGSYSGNCLLISATSNGANGAKFGAYPLTSAGYKRAWETQNVTGSANPSLFLVQDGGNVGIGVSSIGGQLNIGAETASALTGPIKFTVPAATMSTPESQVLGPTTTGNDLSFTIATGAAKKNIILNDGTNLTSGTFPVATTNGRLIDSNLTTSNLKAIYSGGFSGSGTATTTFTVTIGSTLGATTYEAAITPTNALSAALFYVTNKTTTTFDVVFLTGLTGTVTFDWIVTP
jgi:hypothetical protein